MSVNKVILIGNLGDDPKINQLNNNQCVANFSIATSRKWRDKMTNEMREETEWHNIVFFGKIAENCGKYLRKGSKIYVMGRLKTDSSEKEGHKRYFTKIIGDEIQFLSPLDKANSAPSTPFPYQQPQQHPYQNQSSHAPNNFDDDIPF